MTNVTLPAETFHPSFHRGDAEFAEKTKRINPWIVEASPQKILKIFLCVSASLR